MRGFWRSLFFIADLEKDCHPERSEGSLSDIVVSIF